MLKKNSSRIALNIRTIRLFYFSPRIFHGITQIIVRNGFDFNKGTIGHG